MLSLLARNQHNTQSIEASYFDNSAMRTQLVRNFQLCLAFNSF